MSPHAASASIFRGTDEIIAAFLDLGEQQSLKQKSTCLGLTNPQKRTQDFEELIDDLFRQVESNRSDRKPSSENWRLERQTNLGLTNTSPEVLLERAIAILGERCILDDWYNQVPVASGLVDHLADKRAAIDLLQYNGVAAQFIELKWKSDTPVFALFEILRYGLAYILSYINQAEFGYAEKPLMGLSGVSLCVIAPHDYYNGYDLSWLRRGLDHGIRAIASKASNGALDMSVNVMALPVEFELPFSNGEQVLKNCKESPQPETIRLLKNAIENLTPVFESA